MLDIKFIRQNPELIKTNCRNRLVDVDIDNLLELDSRKRDIETQINNNRKKRNEMSKSKPSEEEIQQVKEINKEIKTREKELEKLEKQIKEIMLNIPNLTHKDVVVSDNEDDNPIVEIVKEPKKLDFTPKDHTELAINLDLIDFDRATKVSWAKFFYLKNELALMEIALINYSFEILLKYWFIPIITPDLAKRDIVEEMWYQPRGESAQIYNIENMNLSLIWTSEITVGGYHSNETFQKEDLPKKYVALSHCFRTEAGSYGKFAKWLFRVHQFTKIEMFAYAKPENSEKQHNELVEIEKEIFKWLWIPFRIVDHCTADLWGPSIRTFDLEAWMPWKPNEEGEMWARGEITSTSNCTDFQSRWLNIKYQKEDKTKEFVHTLNWTGIATTRALIAIIENYQQKDWSIVIPQALRKYMNKEIIKR